MAGEAAGQVGLGALGAGFERRVAVGAAGHGHEIAAAGDVAGAFGLGVAQQQGEQAQRGGGA